MNVTEIIMHEYDWQKFKIKFVQQGGQPAPAQASDADSIIPPKSSWRAASASSAVPRFLQPFPPVRFRISDQH